MSLDELRLILAWALVLIPLWIILIGLALIAIGLAWVPFGAALMWKVARDRNLAAGRYAVAGAIYSLLFLIPWIYLFIVIIRGKFTPKLATLLHFILYGFWLLGPVLFLSVISYRSYNLRDISNPFVPSRSAFDTILPIASFMVIAFMWLVNFGFFMYRRSKGYSIVPDSTGKSPSYSFIVPFACAAVSLLIIWATMILPE